MLILNQHDMESLLTQEQVIDAVEAAIYAYEAKLAMVPKRMHLDNGANTLLCMPSWGESFFGTKLVAVIPDNRNKNLPVTNGAMLLNDGITGMPLAFLNASKLTALRTGALGAIGIKLTTPHHENSIGLIGLGVQGLHQAVFACSVRPIKTIYYLKRTEEAAIKLEDFVTGFYQHVKLVPCTTISELLSKTNVLILATTSATPVLPNDEAQVKGKHVIGIGSYKTSMQEIPEVVFKLAAELSIDSEFARHETGDIINPLRENIIAAENVYTIGKLLTGKRTLDVNRTTVFKSAGMALFDLYVAQAMYAAATKQGIGATVEF
jgi:ornithine cyclodeaminase/alanine dehydrogenase-like protein (mu-crystallin family)